jgi:hypothetical protein
MFKHFGDPKPAYVADWPGLPEWQQETDADTFQAIEDSLSWPQRKCSALPLRGGALPYV